MNNVTDMVTRDEVDKDLQVVDYVADRLDSDERVAFERRLESDEALRAAVEEERELRAAFSASPEAGVPLAAAFEKIRDEVDPPRRSLFWRSPSIAAGVAAIALVLVFTIQAPVQQPPTEVLPPEFTGLSENPGLQSPASNRVIVVFAEGVTEMERDVLATELGFELVGGPNEAGAWTAVTIPGVNRDDLARWRQDPRIDLAEPQGYQ